MAKIRKHLQSHISKSHWRTFIIDWHKKSNREMCIHNTINTNALTSEKWCDECGITM